MSGRIQAEYDKEFPGKFLFAAGSAATGTYRGLKLGRLPSRKPANSIGNPLPPRSITPNYRSPGGPAEMVPASATAR